MGARDVMLKWPNDVLLRGRKIAGVLIEVVPGARPDAVVIGIGLNLCLPRAMPPEMRQTATALDDAGITLPPSSLVLARLLESLYDILVRFAEYGFAGVCDDWLSRHAFEGQSVHLLSDFSPPLEGCCRGVDLDGALLLETATGMQRIISGEVSLRKA